MNRIAVEEVYSRIRNYSLYTLGKWNNQEDLNELIIEGIEIANLGLEEIYAAESLLSDCKITGVDLYGGHFYKTIFRNCNVLNSVFRKAELHRVCFENCTFMNCDFSRAELMRAIIKNCSFESCDFSGINFTDSIINDTSFKEINVYDAVIMRNEESGVEWYE